MKSKKISARKIAYSGLFIALGMILPFFTGQIPEIGRMLLPMHIPVLLCGFTCGPIYGMAVGFITPLLRSATLSMPPMFPTAVAMAFELLAYGGFAGLFFGKLPKKRPFIYVSLILAMILGRFVWGAVSLWLYTFTENPFTWQAFMQGAYLTAVPGIILQLIIIPPIVMAVKNAGLARPLAKRGKDNEA